jgi:hypothetical protein
VEITCEDFRGNMEEFEKEVDETNRLRPVGLSDQDGGDLFWEDRCYHTMGVSPCCIRYSLARLKCRLPKKPL